MTISAFGMCCGYYEKMINGGIDNFYLTGREVTLEVLHIVGSIPETPLNIGEEFKFLNGICVVGKLKLVDFASIIGRDKNKNGSAHTILGGVPLAVSDTVTALVRIKVGLGRHPTWIPYGVTVLDIIVLTVGVSGYIVVTETGKS